MREFLVREMAQELGGAEFFVYFILPNEVVLGGPLLRDMPKQHEGSGLLAVPRCPTGRFLPRIGHLRKPC